MKKMRRNAGFTLVEMLIVVAIIAILIAVSIPLVSNSLENARVATDQANERAAKAAMNILYLADDGEFESRTTDASGASYDTSRVDGYDRFAAYHADLGVFSPDGNENSELGTPLLSSTYGYGKCQDNHGTEDDAVGPHDGGYIEVHVNSGTGATFVQWKCKGVAVAAHGTT